MRKLRTHCSRGHQYTSESTYVNLKTGYRSCRICVSITNSVSRNTPEYRKYQANWMRKDRARRGRSARGWELRTLYNLTLEDYGKLYEAQKGLCAICKKPELAIDSKRGKVRDLSIDHNHETKENRGLLCHFCNHALGLFKDSPEICRFAADYLENPPARVILNNA